MNEWLLVLLIILLGYLLGSVPFAWIFARMKGIDLRRFGSGNIGATNAGRAMGMRWFFIIFAGDAGKGVLAVLLAAPCADWLASGWLADLSSGGTLTTAPDFGLWAALGAILGHSFSFWLKFRGGKAVATGVGVLFALNWVVGASALATFLLVLAITRYVSIGSMLGAIMAPVSFGILQLVEADASLNPAGRGLFFTMMALFVIVRHRTNIRRLREGSEHQIGRPKPDSSEVAAS